MLTAIVPFREGSKGFPGKNFKRLDGIPLWERAALQGARVCDRVICSTDAVELDHQSLPEKLIFDRRPADLSSDQAPMKGVISYLIEQFELQNDVLVLLQPTSPLRRDESIKSAIQLYNSAEFSLVKSVVKKDPSILKYGFLEQGQFIPVNEPSHCFQNRQNLPAVYSPNGAFYIFSASDFLKFNDIPCSNIGAIEMSKEESVDIDNRDDFQLAERTFRSMCS